MSMNEDCDGAKIPASPGAESGHAWAQVKKLRRPWGLGEDCNPNPLFTFGKRPSPVPLTDPPQQHPLSRLKGWRLRNVIPPELSHSSKQVGHSTHRDRKTALPSLLAMPEELGQLSQGRSSGRRPRVLQRSA